MKKALIPLLLVVSLLLPAACTGRHSRTKEILAEAERIMDDHPDSAQMLLEQIDTATLRRGTRNRAFYALLITQAHHKNDIPLLGDSAICQAVEYFKAKRDRKHLMIASFYKGQRSYELEKYGDAIFDMLRTQELADQLGDNYWNARAWSNMGLIYGYTNNWPLAPNAEKQAAKYFKLAGQTLYWQWSLRNLAEAYAFTRQFEKADSLLDMLLVMSEEPGANPNLKPNILSLARTEKVWKRDYKRAHQLQAALDSCGGFSPYHDIRDVSMRAILALEADEHQKGLQIVKEGYERYARSRDDSLQLYDAEGRIYRSLGMSEAKSEIIGKILEIQNSFIKQWSEQSVAGAQRDFLREKELEAKKKQIAIAL